MTGFARVRRNTEQGEIVATLKSVNHRGLDLHCRMPAELDALEHDVRGVVKGGVARGHVEIQVSFTRTAGAAATLNRPLLDAYIQAFRDASALHGLGGQPDLNSALSIPGMLSAAGDEEVEEAVARAVLAWTSGGIRQQSFCDSWPFLPLRGKWLFVSLVSFELASRKVYGTKRR